MSRIDEHFHLRAGEDLTGRPEVSRTRALEKALEEFAAKFSRCHRGYNRSMRLGFIFVMRP